MSRQQPEMSLGENVNKLERAHAPQDNLDITTELFDYANDYADLALDDRRWRKSIILLEQDENEAEIKEEIACASRQVIRSGRFLYDLTHEYAENATRTFMGGASNVQRLTTIRYVETVLANGGRLLSEIINARVISLAPAEDNND